MPMYVSFIEAIVDHRLANLFADYEYKLIDDDLIAFIGNIRNFCKFLGTTNAFLLIKETVTANVTIPFSKGGDYEIVIYTKKKDDADKLYGFTIELKSVTYFTKDNGGMTV